MPIITTAQNTNLTLAQKQQRARVKIQGQSNMLFAQMVNVFDGTMETVWNNADGLTPQEVFDGLGTDAGEAVRLSATLGQAINSAKPGTINTTPPKPLTIGDDGKVTVGA